ncbi:hypothetical protein PHYSODRAFT_289118 [Phytophthora sojae]|uniref:Uncharacterized protein n=1 Tax=Phytophthora sojae (strain P6497) TaxID=1094619 RepID=G5ADM1_PHYSP|nr:hypothetical protein PHYSODRAFT_289118 [Phytophthora sojae]EGZ06274.1 hypothetical protein PHYSODRAFT_289118 [Phytophthora sojae]|eukprot:XP_009538171.1 hypothetical protein PHYSODRAFT_289118 [Phytophthora sojae]
MKERAARMHPRLTRGDLQRSIRTALGRVFMYLETGRMHGQLPACVSKKLLQLWPDSSESSDKDHPSARAQ